MDEFCKSVTKGSACGSLIFSGAAVVNGKLDSTDGLNKEWRTGSTLGGCAGAAYHISGKVANGIIKRIKNEEIHKQLTNFSELNNLELPSRFNGD